MFLKKHSAAGDKVGLWIHMMLHFETQDSPGLVALIWFSGFAVGLAVGLCIDVYHLKRRPLAPLSPLKVDETLAVAHLSSLTVMDLKTELRARNPHVTGLKDDLVKRVAASEQRVKETR